MDGMNWRKASYSGNGEACVEVASDQGILVRDTTDREGVTLSVSPAAWGRFTASLKLRAQHHGPGCELSSGLGLLYAAIHINGQRPARRSSEASCL